MELNKKDFIYEGKAKKLYATDDPDVVIVEYKDSFTAFNGEKKATMSGKGQLNNKISSKLFGYLKSKGIKSHFIKQLDDVHQAVTKVSIVPLEVIVRNITTGSLCKRLGVKEGMKLSRPLVEFCYKNDELGDPMINEYYVCAMELASKEELDIIKSYALRVNEFLTGYLESVGIELIDFKLEFGRLRDGKIVLADEISPDTCRFWDSKTGEKLDKDRFRRDMGGVEDAYREILKRLLGE